MMMRSGADGWPKHRIRRRGKDPVASEEDGDGGREAVGPQGEEEGGGEEEEGAVKEQEEGEGEGEGAPSRLCDDEQHADGDPRGDEERPSHKWGGGGQERVRRRRKGTTEMKAAHINYGQGGKR